MPMHRFKMVAMTALAVLAVQQNQRAWAASDKIAGALKENSDKRASKLMESASHKKQTGQFANAEKDMLEARGLISEPLLRAVWFAQFSEIKEARGAWLEAAVHASRALHEYTSALQAAAGKLSVKTGPWTMAVRELTQRSIRNYLLAGLVNQAYLQFENFRTDFVRELLSGNESVLLKRLADELRRLDRVDEAVSVERVAFKHYPFISTQLNAAITPDTICRLDEEMQSLRDKRSYGSFLIQRLGTRPDVVSYALSIAGVPQALKTVQQNPDELSGSIRNEILELVDWLQSIRDYTTALDLTSRLMLSQNFEPPFTREKLIMAHARNLNGVHRPVEAAAFYRNLIIEYPQTEIANTARPRYVLSLHYAGRYEDVAREASSLAGLARPRDVMWRTFWARYLSKQYAVAISSTAHEDGDEIRARLQYWRGRAYESEGKKREAKDIFGRIASMDGSGHYALFASWRLQPPTVQPVSVQRRGVAFAAKSLQLPIDPNIAVLRSRATVSERFGHFVPLATAGYDELIKGPLRRKLFRLSGSGESLTDVLVLSGDANASVQFASQQRKGVGRVPVGRKAEWKPFLAKNAATLKMLYPLPYRETLADAAEAFQINPWLILSIMRAESLFQPQVVSNVGARGLMQIMPTTGERIAEFLEYPDFEPSHLDQPEVNIAFGAWYLARLLTYYQGQLPLAIAAYNAGPEAVDRWLSRSGSMSLDEFLENIPFEQTRKYVATVLTNMEIYHRLYSNGANGVEVNLSAELPTPQKNMEMF